MQEKVKKRVYEPTSEKTREKGEGFHFLKRAITAAARESVWVGCAYLLGHIQMVFGTYPVGLSLLCASGRHTVAILLGAVLSALALEVTPVVYVCTLAVAALIRLLSVSLFEGEGEKDALGKRATPDELVGAVPEGAAADDPAKERGIGAFLRMLFSGKDTSAHDRGCRMRADHRSLSHRCRWLCLLRSLCHALPFGNRSCHHAGVFLCL